MTADCLQQLRSLLDRADRGANLEDSNRFCRELLEIGRRWPKEALQDEAQAIERLSQQLLKCADAQQQDIVGAFPPLRANVRQRMADSTASLNSWLSEAPHPEKASPQRLAELLKAIDDAPQMRWYKQCTDMTLKSQFLVAIASVVRSVYGTAAPFRDHIEKHPRALTLVQRLIDRFFLVPEHGNVLSIWHDGRLERYNATLWRAAKRAATRFKDDLQVRLVSALRRATAPVQPVVASGQVKPQLQLALHEWPMVGCPLARAFLDFVAQRGAELGDLGEPRLGDCPPHSLRPGTLRKLLGRLDAFEVLDGEGSQKGPMVRLRWEAVAALAFKAVGTKPKAGSVPAVGGKLSPEAPVARDAPAGRGREVNVPPPPPLARREANGQSPLRVRAEASAASSPVLRSRDNSQSGADVNSPKQMLDGAATRKRVASGEPRESSTESDSSSSAQRRKAKEKKKKRKKGMLGYGDYFGQGNMSREMMMMNQMMGMSMMMNNPLAMMSMGNPLMAGALPFAGMKMKKEGKDSKKDKTEDKIKKELRDVPPPPPPKPPAMPALPAMPSVPAMPVIPAIKDAPVAPPAPPPKPPKLEVKLDQKDTKLDWSRRKEAMIDADDL